jgi:hypothetical protein
MKSLINSMNKIHWNRMLTLALPIGILLFTQACAPRRLMSNQSTVENPVNYSLNHSGN